MLALPSRHLALRLGPALALCVAQAAAAGRAPFETVTLAPGVLLFRPTEGRTDLTNSLVIERADGLLVVESQPTPVAARELLAAIGKSTKKPIRYLAVSHPHAESAGGASAFAESVLLIGHYSSREALASAEQDFGAEMRARAPDPAAWVEPPRRLPVLLVYGRMDLADSTNPVELRTLQRAHSAADLVVYVPAHKLLYVGGLLAQDRNPYAAADADVGGWVAVLNQISKEAPDTVVALHGPAVGIQGIRTQRDALAWVRGQVEGGFIDQIPLEGIPQHVLQTPGIESRFDLTASPSFVQALVERVLEESVEQRRKRGIM